MNGEEEIWIGADPGGKGNFGIAVLTGRNHQLTSSVDYTDEAVSFVRQHIDKAPSGIGIDAPLWWASGQSGDRYADQWLRQKYGLSSGEVQAANSLRGAVLIQGAIFVQRMRELYPAVPVTESHPKALLKVLTQGNWEEFAVRFGLKAISTNDHERDALIAAISAREGFQKRWPTDLSKRRLPSEQDPDSYWLAPVYYYWPEE
ncbi:hypothetical protein ACFLTO_00340 [Chloroflexota bacterium]